MLKFGVFGVAGHNRGDDAISLSVIDGIRRTFGTCEILVAVLKGAASSPVNADRALVIDRRSPLGLLALLRAIASVDVVLLGGGSLIQDRLGGSRIKGVLGYAWTITAFARILNKPIYTVPMGVDELRTEAAVRVAREVLARLRWIALRDQLSFLELQRVGGPAEAAAVFCDPAFGWTPPIAPTDHADSIVLAPAFEGIDDEVVVEMFVAIAIEIFRRDPSRKLTILAMDNRPETDGGKIFQIYDCLPDDVKQATSTFVPDTAERAVAVLRSAQAVVAMRLHALILSYGYSRCFCLSRTTKTTALLKEFQVDGLEYGHMALDEVVNRASASVSDVSRLELQRSNLARLRALEASYYGLLKQRIENDGLLDKTTPI